MNSLVFYILILIYFASARKCGKQLKPGSTNQVEPTRHPTISKLYFSNITLTVNLKVHIDARYIVMIDHLVEGSMYYNILKNRAEEWIKKTQMYFLRKQMNADIVLNIVETKFVMNMAGLKHYNADIDTLVADYCLWRRVQERTMEDQNIWYYSVLLTGLQLFHINEMARLIKSEGAAPYHGFCKIQYNCAVVQFKQSMDEMVVVFAHELAHSLGVDHDDKTKCDEYGIMAPSLGHGPLPTLWTNCSRQDLISFLNDTSMSWCLGDFIHNTSLIPFWYKSRSKRSSEHVPIMYLNNNTYN